MNPGPLPKTLHGYEVIDYLGQGAGSQIYVVSDPKSSQLYALKHVTCKVEKDERFVDQLKSEFEVGKGLNHPGLRACVDFKVNKTMLRKTVDAILVMQLVDGTPLENQIPDSMADLVDAFIQTAKALDGLHKAGFVHCDLKPNNILRASDGTVKVIDLGQACKIGTKKERIQGTPDYISPEQVKCEPVSARTDVFNFGATMYFCLCKKTMPTLFTVAKSENSFLIDSSIPSPKQNNPAVPDPLSNLVMECVRTAAAKRPDLNECIRRLETVHHALKAQQRNASQRLSGGSRVAAAMS